MRANNAGRGRWQVADRVVVGRQPILDAGLATTAYELLFRGADGASGERMTASVIVDALAEIGLDDLVGARKAFVNVTAEFLMQADGLPFGPESVVVELVEGSQVPDAALLARLERLVGEGYALALDDFLFDPELVPLIELARYVKLDVLALDEAALAEHVSRLEPFRVSLVAEKVETAADYARCRALDFELFQGWFFARPLQLRGRGLPAHRVAALESLAALTAPGVGFDDLDAIISRDVGLTYKLLRYVNSGFFYLPRRLGSVREALTVLGERAVRQWALVMILAGASVGPRELVTLALLRARLCVRAGAPGAPEGELFLVGLLSAADALLGAPMADVLDRLPLEERINRAILDHEGPLGEALARVLALEWAHGDDALPAPAGLPASAYAEATRWADGATLALD